MATSVRRPRWRVELRRGTASAIYVIRVRLGEPLDEIQPDDAPPSDTPIRFIESSKMISQRELITVLNLETLLGIRIEEALNEVEAARREVGRSERAGAPPAHRQPERKRDA